MGVSLSAQLSALSASALLGLCGALLYDLLRALRLHRRRSHALTGLLDALYCLMLIVLLFAFSLRFGGELRLYMIFAALLSGALYFLLLAPLIRPLWSFWAETFFALLRLLRQPFRWLKNFYGKLNKLCKRLFLFSRSSLIMNISEPAARRAGGRKGWKSHGSNEKKTRQYPRAAGTASYAGHRRRPASASAEQDRER